MKELKAYKANIDRNRAVLLAAMEEAVKAAEQTARSHDSGHMTCLAGCLPSPRPMSMLNHLRARELTFKERP